MNQIPRNTIDWQYIKDLWFRGLDDATQRLDVFWNPKISHILNNVRQIFENLSNWPIHSRDIPTKVCTPLKAQIDILSNSHPEAAEISAVLLRQYQSLLSAPTSVESSKISNIKNWLRSEHKSHYINFIQKVWEIYESEEDSIIPYACVIALRDLIQSYEYELSIVIAQALEKDITKPFDISSFTESIESFIENFQYKSQFIPSETDSLFKKVCAKEFISTFFDSEIPDNRQNIWYMFSQWEKDEVTLQAENISESLLISRILDENRDIWEDEKWQMEIIVLHLKIQWIAKEKAFQGAEEKIAKKLYAGRKDLVDWDTLREIIEEIYYESEKKPLLSASTKTVAPRWNERYIRRLVNYFESKIQEINSSLENAELYFTDELENILSDLEQDVEQRWNALSGLEQIYSDSAREFTDLQTTYQSFKNVCGYSDENIHLPINPAPKNHMRKGFYRIYIPLRRNTKSRKKPIATLLQAHKKWSSFLNMESISEVLEYFEAISGMSIEVLLKEIQDVRKTFQAHEVSIFNEKISPFETQIKDFIQKKDSLVQENIDPAKQRVLTLKETIEEGKTREENFWKILWARIIELAQHVPEGEEKEFFKQYHAIAWVNAQGMLDIFDLFQTKEMQEFMSKIFKMAIKGVFWWFVLWKQFELFENSWLQEKLKKIEKDIKHDENFWIAKVLYMEQLLGIYRHPVIKEMIAKIIPSILMGLIQNKKRDLTY